MPFLILFLLCFTLISCTSDRSYLTQYPVTKSASNYKVNKSNDDPRIINYVSYLLKYKYNSDLGIWDNEVLKSNYDLALSLKEFNKNQRGWSVKYLSLKNKTPEQIHYNLISKGFSYQRVPLQVNANDIDNIIYWTLDGKTTDDLAKDNLVYMDIYSHKDGGLVRIKPQGIPDESNLRNYPHAVKAVALKIKFPPDTTWQNEAFKVTEDGIAIPKAPNKPNGLKFLDENLYRQKFKDIDNFHEQYVSELMNRVHIEVKPN